VLLFLPLIPTQKSNSDASSGVDTGGLTSYVGSYADNTLTPGTTPPNTAGGDTSVCLGQVFYLSEAQVITGVQYYRSDGTWDGTDILVGVWDPSGNLLATATSTQDLLEPVGWVQVLFPIPLELALLGVGNQYTVGYRTGGVNLGHYAYSAGFFSSDYSNGAYNVPANGGRFKYVFGPALDQPDHGTSSGYFVDVVTVPTGLGTDATAGSDTSALSVDQSVSDTLSGADTETLNSAVAGNDTVSLIDTTIAQVTTNATDAITTTESASVSVVQTGVDDTASVEAGSGSVFVTAADIGTLIETGMAGESIVGSDTGSSADSGTATPGLFSTDVTASSETGVASVADLGSDTAAAADSAGVSASLLGMDAALTAELSVLVVAGAGIESATGSDTASVNKLGVPKRIKSESIAQRPDTVSSVRTPRTETTRR
jgi:hypothetical protein